LLDQWEKSKPPLSDPKIQDWIHQVMGYYKGMYNLGGEWKTSNDLSSKPDADAVLNQDKHAGVITIKKFYPDFKLTQDHVANAYWGSKK
jgi:hypothetical protein